jgi:DNA-binding response OmpR family regulator
VASILVIDDEVRIQEFIQFVLEEAGHEVRCAGDGIAGLKVQRQRPADLVICDLFMPEKEGLETIQELHRYFPLVKIIAISGGNPRDGRMDFLPLAKQFGAVAALPKPFLPAELVNKVKQVLRG